MGKATITGGGANGLYNISIKYDNARAKARLDAINSQLDTLSNTSIPDALAVKNAAKAQHDTALGYLNDYLNSVTPEQFDPTISGRLTVQAMQTKSVYDEANKAYKKLLLQETALEKEKTKLQNAPEDEAAQAWCADFTEDLTGDVGVIDVGYEDKDIRIIKPHVIEGAGYNATTDGIISSFFNHTAHQLYTNRAYLPAMAKWKPRYRTGSITSLTGDTCNVSLDPYNSSQQRLNINQSTSLTDVPIQYMTCNGAAFEVGDSVVVDFSLDWATPRVIGFMSNPRVCGWTGIPPGETFFISGDTVTLWLPFGSNVFTIYNGSGANRTHNPTGLLVYRSPSDTVGYYAPEYVDTVNYNVTVTFNVNTGNVNGKQCSNQYEITMSVASTRKWVRTAFLYPGGFLPNVFHVYFDDTIASYTIKKWSTIEGLGQHLIYQADNYFNTQIRPNDPNNVAAGASVIEQTVTLSIDATNVRFENVADNDPPNYVAHLVLVPDRDYELEVIKTDYYDETTSEFSTGTLEDGVFNPIPDFFRPIPTPSQTYPDGDYSIYHRTNASVIYTLI